MFAGRPIMNNEEIIMTTNELWEDAHKDISNIFEELLPGYGLTHRPEQEKLSHFMLETMIHSRIALCDAGTGIGKTFAYLVARTGTSMIPASSRAADSKGRYSYFTAFCKAMLEVDMIIGCRGSLSFRR